MISSENASKNSAGYNSNTYCERETSARERESDPYPKATSNKASA